MRQRRGQAYQSDPYLNDEAELLAGLEEHDRRPVPAARVVNHASSLRVRIVTPYTDETGRVRYTPTMREVFQRLGFDKDGYPGSKVWANGWGKESDVLTRQERRALGFKP